MSLKSFEIAVASRQFRSADQRVYWPCLESPDVPGLVVHRNVVPTDVQAEKILGRGPGKVWDVSHAASGQRVARGFERRKDALAFCAALLAADPEVPQHVAAIDENGAGDGLQPLGAALAKVLATPRERRLHGRARPLYGVVGG